MDEKIVIPISKFKAYFFLFLFSPAEVMFLTFWIFPVSLLFMEQKEEPFLREPGLIVDLLAVGFLLFFSGILLAAMVKQVLSFKRASGLIIDDTGMTVDLCSYANFVGHVPWEDVIEIQGSGYSKGSPFFRVIVKNPEKYINKNSNPFFRTLESILRWVSRSPIIITTDLLKYSEGMNGRVLGEIIQNRFLQHRQSKQDGSNKALGQRIAEHM